MTTLRTVPYAYADTRDGGIVSKGHGSRRDAMTNGYLLGFGLLRAVAVVAATSPLASYWSSARKRKGWRTVGIG